MLIIYSLEIFDLFFFESIALLCIIIFPVEVGSHDPAGERRREEEEGHEAHRSLKVRCMYYAKQI